MKNLWKSIVNFFWYPVDAVVTTPVKTTSDKPKRVKKPKVETPTTVETTEPKKPRKKKTVEGNASLLGDAAKE